MEVSNQICSVLLLLESSEHHLCPWDIFLGVDEVFVQGVLAPCDALVLVGLGVGEASSLTSFPSNHAAEVGSLLVFATSLHSVTLGTGLGEDLLASSSTHPAPSVPDCLSSESE